MKKARQFNSQKKEFFSVEISIEQLEAEDGIPVICTISVQFGQPMKNLLISEIWLNGINYAKTYQKEGEMRTNADGKFEFLFSLKPKSTHLEVVVLINGRIYQKIFRLADKKISKKLWFEVKIGDPANDGKVKGRIIVKENDEHGPLAKAHFRISSDRPFAMDKVRIKKGSEQMTERKITVNEEMLFQIEMYREKACRQQQIFFVCQETGEEVKELLVKRLNSAEIKELLAKRKRRS